MSSGPELRIGDAERDAAVSALGEHYAAGRLTKDEYDERSAVAWTAKTNADLWPLFADLPSPQDHQRSAGDPTSSRGPLSPIRRGRNGWRVPFLPVLLIAVTLVILLDGPWPLFVLGWLWLLGCFRGGWFGWGRWSHTRSPWDPSARRTWDPPARRTPRRP